jgi:putative FmdB family regulatory protein
MTYEYECKKCQNTWEQEQSITEAPIKECPKCKAQEAKRLISRGTGFILTGGGWAANGYAK